MTATKQLPDRLALASAKPEQWIGMVYLPVRELTLCHGPRWHIISLGIGLAPRDSQRHLPLRDTRSGRRAAGRTALHLSAAWWSSLDNRRSHSGVQRRFLAGCLSRHSQESTYGSVHHRNRVWRMRSLRSYHLGRDRGRQTSGRYVWNLGTTARWAPNIHLSWVRNSSENLVSSSRACMASGKCA